MKKILLFLAAVASTVGCTTDEQALPTPDIAEEKEVTITVAATTAQVQSRVAISDDNNASDTTTGSYSVDWTTEDQLSAWDGTSSNKFNIDNVEEGLFKGAISTSAEELYFVHPYVAITNGSFDIDLTAQTAKADLSHMNAQTYMRSAAIAVSDNQINSAVAMTHIGAIADVKIICEAAADYTLNKVVLSSLGSKATINIASDDYTATTDDITVTVDGITATDGCFTVPVNILETVLAAGSTITIEATFTDADGAEHTGEKVININSETTLLRSTRNTLKATIELAAAPTPDPVPVVWTLNAMDMSAKAKNTNEVTETVGNVEYGFKTVWQQAGYMNFAANTGCLYNKTALENISKIELDIIKPGTTSATPWITIYAGSESGSKTDAEQIGKYNPKFGSTLTVDVTKEGCSYFYIAVASPNAGVTEIRVTNESEGEVDSGSGPDQGGDDTGTTPAGENLLNQNHYGFENNTIGTWWNNGKNTWNITNENPASGSYALKLVYLASSTGANDGQILAQGAIAAAPDSRFSLTAGKYELSFMLRVDVKSTSATARNINWTIANNNATGSDVWKLQQTFPIAEAENALGEWTKISKTVTFSQNLTDARLRLDFIKTACTAGTTYCIDDISIVAVE